MSDVLATISLKRPSPATYRKAKKLLANPALASHDDIVEVCRDIVEIYDSFEELKKTSNLRVKTQF